jgi:hypothetical protein
VSETILEARARKEDIGLIDKKYGTKELEFGFTNKFWSNTDPRNLGAVWKLCELRVGKGGTSKGSRP